MLYFLFFCSGLSGLIYQVVWVRVFGNVFGNTVYSASLVVAVFMLGLGVGSVVAGAWSDRRYAVAHGTPLWAYGYAEIAIAGLGLTIAMILPHLDRVSTFVTAYVQQPGGWYVMTTGSYVARAAVTVVLLTPIAALMGATLTLLIRHLVRQNVEHDQRRIGLLYAVNTAGAAAGCFLTDFLLVPAWGLLATQLVAVALNLVAGVGALLLARTSQLPIGKAQGSKLKAQGSRLKAQGAGLKAPGAGRKAEVTAGPSLRDPVVLTSVALALSGCAGLGMEILWFRHFSMMLGAFRAVFSLLLTVILVGIGVGSLGAGWMQRRIRRPAQWLIVVQSLFIACTLGGMALADSRVIDRDVSDAIGALVSATPAVQTGWAWTLSELWFNLRPMLVEVAVPALLMGVAFPLANALVQRAEASVGRRAGLLYFANTAGAVVGSLVAGFGLLPVLGLQASATVLMAVAALGLVPLALATTTNQPTTNQPTTNQPPTTNHQRVLAVGGAVAVTAGALALWAVLPVDFVRARALPLPNPDERVLNQSEGVNEIVTITETEGKGRTLMTNGHAMSATWPLSQRYMRALAHVPLLMLDRPRRALVIGFGVGNTTDAASLHPSLERVEVADLSRNVLDHATFFSEANHGVLANPRVSVFLNDGRHHLEMQPPESYDLVALEPPPIGYAGVAALYSEEFYSLARTRLTASGFISQWLPAYQVPTATTLSMIRAFVNVFPQAVLLSGAGADLILIGAKDRIEVAPDRLFAALTERPRVRADLARLDLGTPREIVGMFVGSARRLADATRDAQPVTDDRPVQEYGVRSLLNLGESVPGSVVGLSEVSAWCPACFDKDAPVPIVEGLDLYLALLAQAYAATPQDVRRLSGTPDRVLAGSRYLGAVVPESADAHNDLGIAFASKGQMDQAIAEFNEALRLEPDSAATHWHLGAALASRGALDQAAEHLRRSVELDPANDDARRDLAAVLASARR
jgi:spermidine synthase